MKTLIEINIEPKVGMIVESLKGRYKHHIIDFGLRFLNYDKHTGKAVYGKHVHTICETGSGAWVEYNHFINNYGFVGMSESRLKDLFAPSNLKLERIDEVKKMISKMEELLK